MKKLRFLSVILIIVVLCFLFSACKPEEKQNEDSTIAGDFTSAASLIEIPYTRSELEQYLTLPDYEGVTVKDAMPKGVTDQDVEDRISEILLQNGTVVKVTDGEVKSGDRINISFSGSLEDGSTVDGINAESLDLTLGEENMIAGFQEGIEGKAIGEHFQLELVFPDPYAVLPDIQGHTVTFDMIINYKSIINPATLNDEFVRENSSVSTVSEYKAQIRRELEEYAEDIAIEDSKNDLYSQIEQKTEIHEIPAERVTEYREQTVNRYKEMAEQKGYEWKDFIKAVFGFDEEDFDAQMTQYAMEMVKQETIIYSIAYEEDIQISEEEFEEYMDLQLKNSGYSSRDEFESAAGMTIQEYVKRNHLILNAYLSKELNQIYERLQGK